ncbi:SURF1 family protein [Sphingomonas sp.]|uniref:SURF1 family protein n=1 Tax=Sphingomonas sp. TaxID=28214 RepID=UPI002B6F0392|nr:SURF1 family protein [Sphingomonas sp.]HTG38145.1 SURF1 family protein [Sphingomonas sp.]
MTRLIARAGVLALIGVFVALGVWQLDRRAWKLDLIERVEARLAAPPGAPPLGAVGRDDEYKRVMVCGRYLTGHDTYVQAVTELGGGFWVLTPLDSDVGRILVNRGFVTPDRRGQVPPPQGPVAVTGLLRLSEPGGGFLRANDPKGERWYSRDVAAISAARGLGAVAPWFLDAGANGAEWPRGGLTVVRFRNQHLQYALTWFAMAALLAFLAWRVRGRG